MRDGVFYVQARRCLRCGRLLTGREAIERGYGCRCAEKARKAEEELKPMPGQIDIFSLIEGEQEG